MADAELMARLAQHRALGTAPASEHAWLAAHGVAAHARASATSSRRKGEQATSLHIVLSGHVVIRVDRGAGSHKIFEWRAGDVGGLMPYSRGASPPGDAVAEEPTEVLAIAREQFPELIRECPVVTATLVHAMVDRARQFTSSDLRDEKLISLGKLAAGLAHELNNPASAVVRSAKTAHREPRRRRGGGAAARRARACPTRSSRPSMPCASCACAPGAAAGAVRPMARADREDAIADWLAAHGASERVRRPARRDRRHAGRTRRARGDRRAATRSTRRCGGSRPGAMVRTLASEIETAASRIHDLVGAVKGFTYMDHAPTPEPVDIRRGIADTFTMLGAKTRAKSVEVSVELAADLPRAHAVGAELNQVWMNLIDNALDAVAVGGHVDGDRPARAPGASWCGSSTTDPASRPRSRGASSIPSSRRRAWARAPGLGLDIVRRLVQQHEGEIEVESRPGRTEFQVSLPAEGGRISPR